jgi:hypothetical protein
MIENSNLSNFMQENLLCLLAYDEVSIPLIQSNVKPEMFDSSFYREIATQAINFWNSYHNPIGDHLPDSLEHIWQSGDEKKIEIYKKILQSIFESKDSVNRDYVLDNLKKFVRLQDLKLGIKDAIILMQKGDVEGAEARLERSRGKRLELFDPGTMFGVDMARTFSFVESIEESLILTGIKGLDDIECVPATKELYTMVAKSGGGKSWALVHLGKFAMMQRKSVLHITLELSEERLKARYFQTLFGLGSRSDRISQSIPIFKTDELGRLTSLDFSTMGKVDCLDDANIIALLKEKLNRIYKPKLIIKEFPSGSLTIEGLRAYIENLQTYKGFTPDIILLDYLDLMYMDQDRMRIDLGRTAVDLRGMADEYNTAMVTVAQTNRGGEGTQLLTRKHLAEDFSKVRVSDNLITFNQTPQEEEYGLARIFVDKARNTKGNDIFLISQNLSCGQYCIDSCRLSKTYYDLMKTEVKEEI